eukprot:TRINITY_DN7489_c0_g1_i1.p1 TRINITY_DN7489_c0_g1~~TRINITY_DN7489_c0_g1_i1.p1  ORF type:complete len:599 (+),score=118.38 TRINITY_DN7489_c0_g1_i1:82-1878(+)
MKALLLFFVIASALTFVSSASSRPDNIPTYKINGSYFNATFFNAWIRNQTKYGVREVGLFPGTYQVYAGYEFESYPIQFYNVNNLKVWMDGVKMIFMNVKKPGFSLNNCTDVTLVGVTTSYNETPYGQAKVTAITKASADTYYLDMDIPEGFSTRWWKTIITANVRYGYVFNPVTKQPYMPKYKVEINPMATAIRNNNDSLIRWTVNAYYITTSSGLPNIHVGDYFTIRGDSGAFHYFQGCERITYKDVTLLQGGFAVISAGGGGHTFDGMVITFGPDINGVPQLVTTAGDGLHVGSARVGPTIKNCFFEGMQDDGINIYNYFSNVSSISGDNVLLKRLGGGIEVWKAGDVLRFYNGTLISKGYATISSIQSDNRTFVSLKLSGDYSLLNVGDFVSNTDFNSHGFLITNNTFRNHRARGMLIKGSNGIITNNRISNTSLGGIALMPEQAYFVEADYSVNVTVTGNHIDTVNYVGEKYGSISLYPRFSNSDVAKTEGFSNIIIRQNVIVNSFGNAIRVHSAVNVTIDQNYITPGPFDSGLAAIGLDTVNAVSVTSNCITNSTFPSARYVEAKNVTMLSEDIGVQYCTLPTIPPSEFTVL